MANNDWNNLGRDIKDIVQDALDTGNFNRLNRDLGATLEDALGNVANSVKDVGKKRHGPGKKQYETRVRAAAGGTGSEDQTAGQAPAGLTQAALRGMTGPIPRMGFSQDQDTGTPRQSV